MPGRRIPPKLDQMPPLCPRETPFDEESRYSSTPRLRHVPVESNPRPRNDTPLRYQRPDSFYCDQ